MFVETLIIAGICSLFVGGIVFILLLTDNLTPFIVQRMLGEVEQQYDFSNGRVNYCKSLPLSEADKLNQFVKKYALEVSYVKQINGIYEDKWLSLIIKMHKNNKMIITRARAS